MTEVNDRSQAGCTLNAVRRCPRSAGVSPASCRLLGDWELRRLGRQRFRIGQVFVEFNLWALNRFSTRTTGQLVPFHFWSLVFFVFGCMVGSFLNVCIHRMPLGMSIVTPPSHCPHCKYSIPWYLNIPLVTWLALRGRCKNCGAPISPRYFIVELLTGVTFLGCWLAFGRPSHPVHSMPAGAGLCRLSRRTDCGHVH